MIYDPNVQIGILGGGQLGRMMIQSALNLNLNIRSMDADSNAPCLSCANTFVQGDLLDYKQVIAFGQPCDIITVEVENVNVEALEALEAQGKKVFPQPATLRIIKDKGIQKQFYLDHDIPTSPFVLTDARKDLMHFQKMLPAVHKLRTAGYDGKGVQILRTKHDFPQGFDKASILEKFVNYAKEISVIVARNERDEISTYPVVELEYHAEANLVEFLFSPPKISVEVREKARNLAIKIIRDLDMVGLLAVEMFVTPQGDLIVNECAPRPHNSGHHSIEGNITSQFEQHLRAILNLPLGDTSAVNNAVMINLLGDEHHTGIAKYDGIDHALGTANVHVHLYGKKMTKPFRKMGHITLIGDHLETLKKKARSLKDIIKIIS